MPRRKQLLITDEIYHVFNRSIAREAIFASARNLNRLKEIVEFYRFHQSIRYSKYKLLPAVVRKDYDEKLKKQKPLVEIYAFVFMPNHYHFLLKQTQESGIHKFIAKLQNSFAKYFNLKSNRPGGLFQNAFKAKRVETDEQFLHLSRYIHLNPVTAFICDYKDLTNYEWCSYSYYMSPEKNRFIDTEFVIGLAGSKENYLKFVSDRSDYQKELRTIKHLIME